MKASIRQRNARLTLLSLAVIAILLVACSGGKPSSSNASPTAEQAGLPAGAAKVVEAVKTAQNAQVPGGGGFDACALVTKAEAEKILGKPVSEPESENVPMMSTCHYETEDLDSLVVLVVEFPDAQVAAEASKQELTLNKYKEIKGIGDLAWWPSPIMDISVLQDQYQLSIDLSDGRESEAQHEEAKKLANIVLSRLP